VSTFTRAETRFSMLRRVDPDRAHHLEVLAQADADERWRYYSQLAGLERTVPHEQTSPHEQVEPDLEDNATDATRAARAAAAEEDQS
jgi:pyruvate-ferredoxin/flavodoxin oxidoreductase